MDIKTRIRTTVAAAVLAALAVAGVAYSGVGINPDGTRVTSVVACMDCGWQ